MRSEGPQNTSKNPMYTIYGMSDPENQVKNPWKTARSWADGPQLDSCRFSPPPPLQRGLPRRRHLMSCLRSSRFFSCHGHKDTDTTCSTATGELVTLIIFWRST